MSVKCSKCNIDFPNGEVNVKCSDCKCSFHPSCTSLGSVQNLTKTKSRQWKCDGCKDDTSSNVSGRSNDDSEDKKQILEALTLMRQELRQVKDDINSNVDTKIGEVQRSVNSLKEDFNKLDSKITTLESTQNKLVSQCNELEKANNELTAEVRELRIRLEDSDQHSRCANIEVVGLPYTQGENVYECLKRIAAVLQVPFQREDVSIAHRLRLFSKKHQYAPIIAQFVSRTTKETWLAAARTKKTIISTDISASLPRSSVYVNEHLTSHNKALLGRARRLQREKKIHFAGFFNGKVLIRVKEGDAAVRCHTLEDLDIYDRPAKAS